ncbi:alpha/beta hydrolase [Antarcticibacterium sp. 1MA-6-2]|uniref:alpha/beta hydrolase n=1 Tax=Antarcticibacterium sp. 1MA-6-2 TaxID=2908210 RepID=UPI002882FCB3|nr:alpha/beta hydrolase [Antarcticibacterium sp. 1MA-6-2]
MNKTTVALILFLLSLNVTAQKTDYVLKENIKYYHDSVNRANEYINERALLDIYYPKEEKGFPTVVWFHGGGLTSGSKFVPQELKEKGIAVVSVNYRLSPRAKSPSYIEDAAAAVAWVFKNIKSFGGNPDLIFVSGHSA